MTALQALGELGTTIDISPQAKSAACEAIVDLVTAAAAAPRRSVTAALREAYGPGASSVWFTGERASPVAAGFVNALHAAALDLDDGHRLSRGHPGAAVIPAVFAQADHIEAGGQSLSNESLIRAVVIGYELSLRIASARGFYARTGFWAGFAAAAGAGSLAGLSAIELANAMAIAGETGPHMATTTTLPAWPQPNGSDVKEGIPWGVATGLSAVTLARAGITGALDLVDHPPFFDAEAILAERSGPAICETYTKFYAACRHVHAPVEALLALVAQHGLRSEEIEAIDVAAYSGALRIPNSAQPRNLIDAQYSIPYCLGLASLYGGDCLLPMTERSLHDEAAEQIALRVGIHAADECEARFPAETVVRVTVQARGQSFVSALTAPTGEATRRPDWDSRIRKFQVATRDTLPSSVQDRFVSSFDALRTGALQDLRALLAHEPALRQSSLT